MIALPAILNRYYVAVQGFDCQGYGITEVFRRGEERHGVAAHSKNRGDTPLSRRVKLLHQVGAILMLSWFYFDPALPDAVISAAISGWMSGEPIFARCSSVPQVALPSLTSR